jgi:hypothetical protein
MDTQDFLDNINSWLDFYRDVRDPELIYPPAVRPDDIKWEDSMLRIAASFKICDSLTGTPAQKKVEQAISLALSGDRMRIKDIYDIFIAVARFLGDNSGIK